MAEASVLITGGAGFIGRAVAARCLAAGHRVAVLDNLAVGRLENLDPFRADIDFHEVDVLDEAGIDKVMDTTRPEIVFHLAAHHFIPFCDAHPSETLAVNVTGSHIILSSAARHGVRTAVVASSGAFYASLDDLLTEDLAPAPVDVYGLSKQMTEDVTRFIAASTDVACVAARFFNAYGPYETNPHLIPHIVDELRKGDAIHLGNVKTKRDYVFVNDIAEMVYLLSQAGTTGHTVVNVGTGIEYSAEDIVHTIGELLGRPVEVVVDPDRVRNVDKMHQRADTSRLEALVGARPGHSLPDGLAELLRHEGFIDQ